MRRSYHPKCRILATPEIIGGAPILGIMFNVERNGEPFDGSEPGLYCGFAFLDRLDEPRSALNFYDFDRVKQIDIHVEEVMEKPVPGFYWRESALVPFTWEEIDLSEDADPVESDSDEGEEGQSKPRDAR